MKKRDIYMILLGAVIGIFSVLLFLFMFFDNAVGLVPILVTLVILTFKLEFFNLNKNYELGTIY
jgi:hypothetical protein